MTRISRSCSGVPALTQRAAEAKDTLWHALLGIILSRRSLGLASMPMWSAGYVRVPRWVDACTNRGKGYVRAPRHGTGGSVLLALCSLSGILWKTPTRGLQGGTAEQRGPQQGTSISPRHCGLDRRPASSYSSHGWAYLPNGVHGSRGGFGCRYLGNVPTGPFCRGFGPGQGAAAPRRR